MLSSRVTCVHHHPLYPHYLIRAIILEAIINDMMMGILLVNNQHLRDITIIILFVSFNSTLSDSVLISTISIEAIIKDTMMCTLLVNHQYQRGIIILVILVSFNSMISESVY